MVGDLLPELGPFLLPAAPARLRVAVERGASLPTAVRTADGRLAWQCRKGRLTLAATGGVTRDLAPDPDRGPTDLAARLPVVLEGGRHWTEPGEVTRDGLPLVGRLDDRPLAVACGFGPLGASLSFVAARWIADALLTGHDPTPGPFRSAPRRAGVV
jgi:glycine/D-amino acid oxidase-like deaminating enzyme